MSEKWSNGSLDALMSELDRMVKERGDAEKARPSFEYAQDTLREADAVLGLDSDPLADLSVWEQSPAPTAKKEEDVIVRETRYGQEKFETPEPEDLYSHTLLADEGQLMAYRHEGFWQCMDTQRDHQLLEKLWASGQAPWKVWAD